MKLPWDECHYTLQVNIGSGNGLVPSGNKPLPWANVDPDVCRQMESLGLIELTQAIQASHCQTKTYVYSWVIL